MGPLEDNLEYDAPTLVHSPENFVTNLIIERQDRGLTRQDIADRLGRDVRDLMKLELLTEYPDTELIQQYALVLGWDVVFDE